MHGEVSVTVVAGRAWLWKTRRLRRLVFPTTSRPLADMTWGRSYRKGMWKMPSYGNPWIPEAGTHRFPQDLESWLRHLSTFPTSPDKTPHFFLFTFKKDGGYRRKATNKCKGGRR